MSRKRVDKVINEVIPQIEDNRDTKDDNSFTISNYKRLDAVADKETIDKYIKEKQDALHNPFYSIDLNTSKVKQNEQVSFIVDVKKPKHNISKDDELDNLLHQEYKRQIEHFNIDLDKYLNKKYTSFTDLDDDIVSFNTLYDKDYYKGFNLRVRNYLDDDIKREYVNKYSNAVATLQLKEIKEVLDDVLDIVNVDIDNTEILTIINKEWLKKIQELVRENYTISDDSISGTLTDKTDKDKIKEFVDDFNRDDVDIFIFNIIKEMLINEQIDNLNASIENHKEYYKTIDKLYKKINKKIIDITNNFSNYYSKLNDYTKAVAPKQADNKPINLHLAKVFNNTYPLNKYTSIDKNKNEKYDVRLKVIYEDTNFDDLRDIIFVDDISNKQLSLLPIDLALFVGFTTINNVNGGNIPITLTDAFKFISEDKKIRIRKGQKAYQLYDDKMQMFKSFKVKSVIKDRETNKTLIEFKDAVPILENYKVHLASRGDMGYIIGASAILSILNFLSEQEDIDYLTTFSNANNYINDNQSNTIETLNMKYYLIIKVLQMGNANKRGIKYNPKVNLDDLYRQTAQLKGVSELSKQDKTKLRGKINTYLEHLKGCNLIENYDYNPLNQLTTSDKSNTKIVASNNTAKNNLYIKVK